MAGCVGPEGYLRQQKAILERPDSLSLLPKIAVPTLVGVGDCDLLTPPEEAMRIHEGVAGSSLHIFAACGHLPPLERSQETTDLLREWLMKEQSRQQAI
jgi:pimeloyl-ACP methyl ester carboxylesterase